MRNTLGQVSRRSFLVSTAATSLVAGSGLAVPFYARSADRLRDQGVDGEGVFGIDRLGAGREKGARRQFEDVVGTVAEHQLCGLQAELGAERIAQREAVAVGITGDVEQRLLHGLYRLRTGAERVFVGSELDDVAGLQTQFSRKF